MQDVTALRREERERSAAQKLESVGRLAAGIAHEINTPLQYVNDNMQFLQSSFESLGAVLVNYRNLETAVESGVDVAAAAKVARTSAQSIDLDFLMENTTPAVSEARSGLDRITAIVRSMKEFAHPDGAQKAIADLKVPPSIRVVYAGQYAEYSDGQQVGDLQAGDVARRGMQLEGKEVDNGEERQKPQADVRGERHLRCGVALSAAIRFRSGGFGFGLATRRFARVVHVEAGAFKDDSRRVEEALQRPTALGARLARRLFESVLDVGNGPAFLALILVDRQTFLPEWWQSNQATVYADLAHAVNDC